jgi:hypothetical protein
LTLAEKLPHFCSTLLLYLTILYSENKVINLSVFLNLAPEGITYENSEYRSIFLCTVLVCLTYALVNFCEFVIPPALAFGQVSGKKICHKSTKTQKHMKSIWIIKIKVRSYIRGLIRGLR